MICGRPLKKPSGPVTFSEVMERRAIAWRCFDQATQENGHETDPDQKHDRTSPYYRAWNALCTNGYAKEADGPVGGSRRPKQGRATAANKAILNRIFFTDVCFVSLPAAILQYFPRPALIADIRLKKSHKKKSSK